MLVFCPLTIQSNAAWPAEVFLCGRVCFCSSPSVVQASCEPVEASGMFSRRGCCLLCLLLRAAAQRYVSFDEAIASSVFSAKTFGADLAMTESSGYWCSAGGHAPGQVVSWTGVFKSRRKLTGVTLRWSYAPAEVKVLTSSDGGNFQESAGWRKLERTEPSFEDTILFSEPVTVKAVKVMMRGSKPWGYFGLSNAVALSEPSAFMLVSGAPAPKEQCVVAASDGLAARPCVDAVVTGQGSEIFASGAAGQLQMLDGRCLGIVAEKLSAVECQEGQGGWSISQDGQVRQGSMCLAVAGSRVAAADCDDAAAAGGDKFFQVAVPAHDPTAVVAVKEVGALLRASVQRQRGLVAGLQQLAPKLASCKPASLKQSWPALVQLSLAAQPDLEETLAAKVGAGFGPSPAELASVFAASADALKLVSSRRS